MKLGLMLGYSGAEMKLPVELVQRAEALGFDSVWTAEAYGSDATSPLAYLAAAHHSASGSERRSCSSRGGRPPWPPCRPPPSTHWPGEIASSPVSASAGRRSSKAGMASPGVGPTGAFATTSRSCARSSSARSLSPTTAGRSRFPTSGEGALGIGKPLKSILHMNPKIPIWLGTGSESNVRLTAEIADGWFPLAFVPGMMDLYRPWLEEGFRRAGGGKSLSPTSRSSPCVDGDRHRRHRGSPSIA